MAKDEYQHERPWEIFATSQQSFELVLSECFEDSLIAIRFDIHRERTLRRVATSD